jgi:hypothetical protein
MDSLEEIGALLGFVAFAGLAVLVFLTFQQARHIRRLRDWAGRAPERAAAIAARENGEDVPEEAEDEADDAPLDDDAPASREPRLGLDNGESRWVHFREEMRVRWIEWDRRSPVDLKLLMFGIVAVVVGLAIATGGFGLVGGDDGGSTNDAKAGKESASGSGSGDEKTTEDEGIEVAVLNGTAPPGGGTGVPGVADKVSGDVESACFTVGAVDDAGSFTSSIVMYSGDAQTDAEDLAAAMEPLLGDVEVVEMTPEIEALTENADIALIVGQDDSAV